VPASEYELESDPETESPAGEFMIDIIINRDAGAWEAGFEAQAGRAAEATLAAVPGAAERFSVGTLELGITLSDDDTVRALNREHRGQDKPTNVLSFPLIDRPLDQGGLTPEVPEAPLMLGDVILAWETVVREAGEQGKGAVDHATHLVVHGVLHLLGYDHQAEDAAGTMERLEIAVLAGLGIADPYAGPSAAACLSPAPAPEPPAPEPPAPEPPAPEPPAPEPPAPEPP
jgi:probable rRNA maturation factor